MELKHILAATDFSDLAGQAVGRAALLAQQHGATLHLIHVVPSVSWKIFGRALIEHPLITEKHLYESAQQHLQEQAETCRKRFGLDVRCHADIGRPHDVIAAYATQIQADLNVLGPHADNLLHDLFIGSTARKVLHKGRQPTLIAQVKPDTPYRRVLVAVDFSDASRVALEAALRFAPDAAVHLLHVYDVLFEGKMRYAGVEENVIEQYRDAAGTEAWRLMHEFLEQMGARDRVQPIVQNGYPARAILDEAQNLQIDLIVMGKRGRSELDELFLGSVTETILYDLDRDLLLVSN